MSKDLVFSNVSIDEKKAYLLYLGEFRHHKICHFLKKPLKKYYNKNIGIIYIFKNLPSKTFRSKYIVINPGLKKAIDNYKQQCYYSITYEKLNKHISESPYIRVLIKKILKNQKDLYLIPYKDTPELTLHHKFKRVKLLGPSTSLFKKFDNKFFQHEIAQSINIPLPEWYLARNKNQLIKLFSKHFQKKGAFISRLHGYGGKYCAIVKSRQDISNHPRIKNKTKYIISELIDIKVSPSIEVVLANENESFLTCVTDQILKQKMRYRGGIYPSKLNKKTLSLIEDYTKSVAKYLGRKNYKGYFGIDYMVDKNNKLYFSEINPRMTANTIEKIYTHELIKQKNFPSLPELELNAIINNTFGDTNPFITKKPNFRWGMMHIRILSSSLTTKDFPQKYSETEAFKKHKTVILDFPGKNIFFCNDSILCRVLAVKKTRKEVEKELNKTEKLILSSIKKV